MRIDRRETQKTDNSAGVSEIIGAVLLISLVVVSIGIVAALLFSQTAPPTKIPNMNFMTGVSAGNTTLYLYHSGGDPLNVGEFNVLVDGVPKPYNVSGGGSQWSLGTNLIVPISTVPKNVQIVYNGGSTTGTATTYTSTTNGTVLVRQGSNVNSTVNIPADQAPYLDCSAVANPVCAALISPDTVSALFLSNLSSDYIYFGRDSQVTLATTNSFFNFTVIGTGSSIQLEGVNPYPYLLNDGDTVSIFPNGNGASTSLKIFAIRGRIWELRALAVNYNITTSAGVVRVKGGSTTFDIFNANIINCQINSTLDITSTTTASNILLVMNDTVKLNTNVTGNAINIVNMRPTKTGVFSFIHDAGNPNNVYFIGKADSVTVNGVAQV
jgi:FlaG/FlaF family flagellin (archaellin)